MNIKHLKLKLRLIVVFVFYIGASYSSENNGTVYRDATNAIVVNSVKVTEINEEVKQKMQTLIKNYSVFSVDVAKIYSEVKKEENDLVIKLNFGENYSWDIKLQHVDLRSSDYVLQMKDEGAIVNLSKIFETGTYKGVVNGDETKIARLSIRDNSISGYVQDGDHFVYIEPFSKIDSNISDDMLVVYEMKEMNTSSFGNCDFSEEDLRPSDINNESRGINAGANCRNVEIALIADYSMLLGFGNVAQVEKKIFDIVNQAQGYYDLLDIQLSIKSIVVPISASANPFNNQIDVTQFFTTLRNYTFAGIASPDIKGAFFRKDFSNKGDYTVAGTASGTACSISNRSVYEVSIFDGVAGVVFAHEIAHNLSAVHTAGANYIMNSTSTASGTTWDPANITNINNFLNGSGASCISGCNIAPQANFTQDVEYGCSSLKVNFKDRSSVTPTSWFWEFGDGTTSTDQNPIYSYSSVGTYTVKLTAKNTVGENTIIKTDVIKIEEGDFITPLKVGLKPDYNITTGGFKTASAWMQFNALDDFVLKSFEVNAEVAGTRMLLLSDDTAKYNLYRADQFYIPQGISRVTINWQIKGGKTYFLMLANDQAGLGITKLWRNQQGASYPQTIPGVISITTNHWKSKNPTDPNIGWYIGYDWEIQPLKCAVSVGVEDDLTVTKKINFYPNPATNFIVFDGVKANSKIELYDVLGKKVITHISKTDNVQLDLSVLNRGVYFVQISSFDIIIKKGKFIKE